MRLADLERIAEELGEEKGECRAMLREADKDEDGTLNFEEFMRVVKKTSYFWSEYCRYNIMSII